MTLHEMKLNREPFEKIRLGEKDIELRLYDEKRRLLCVGDRIRFCEKDGNRSLTAEIRALHRFASFEELYASLPLIRCGYCAQELATASPADMNAYYTPEEQRKWGVLGIEIKLC